MLTIFKWLSTGAAGLVLAAYLILPFPSVRPYSGAPPLFSFGASVGNGFFVGTRGVILTNEHVVHACRRISISGFGFRAQPVKLIANDVQEDLAILRSSVSVPAFLTIAPLSPSGPGRIIGYSHFRVAPSPKEAPVQITSIGTTQGMRIIHGLFRRGQSGSPIIDQNGYVAGSISQVVIGEGQKNDWIHGGEGNTGAIVQGRIMLNFLFTNSDLLPKPVNSTILPNSKASLVVLAPPAEAVVRIFCFSTLP